jgi:tetratricopeptide (TPR) repeat protein
MAHNQRVKCRAAIFAAAVAATFAIASGDSLVTRNGDVYIGTISTTDSGYTVQPTSGPPVDVAAADVKRVLLDHPDPTEQTDSDGSSIVPARTPAPVKGDSRAIKKLLAQGTAAYEIGSFTDARDAFTDALAIDPTNVTASRGLGFSYLRLKNAVKAAKPLEIAAGTSPVLDRPLTIAISSVLLATHNAMRAVKYMKLYFEAHPAPPDEQLLNAFGGALSQVDTSAVRSDLFKDASKLYQKLNADLEATQPGKKRWGIIWLDAADVDQKLAARQKAQKQADAAMVKLQQIDSHLASVKNERANVNLTTRYTKERDATIHRLDHEISDAEANQSKAQSESDQLSEALLHVANQEFPSTIETDDVDLPLTVSVPSIAAGKPDSATSKTVAAKTGGAKNPASVGGTETTPTPAQPVAVDQHVTRYAVAFAIAPDLVVTASDAVADAVKVHVETPAGISMAAEIVRTNRGIGLALLRVKKAHFSCLELAPVMTHGAIKAWSYPQVTMFNAVAQEMNCAAPAPGAQPWAIRFQSSPRLPGGPVLQGGLLVGVELATRDSDPLAAPAASLADLRKFLADDANPGTPASDPKSAIVQVVAEQ